METKALVIINQRLAAWFLTPDSDGFEQMTDVVKKNLIGGEKSPDPCLDAKAGQSRMLLFFSVALMKQVVPRLQGEGRKTAEGLLASSLALTEWYNIIRTSGSAPPPQDCVRCVRTTKKHVTLWSSTIE